MPEDLKPDDSLDTTICVRDANEIIGIKDLNRMTQLAFSPITDISRYRNRHIHNSNQAAVTLWDWKQISKNKSVSL